MKKRSTTSEALVHIYFVAFINCIKSIPHPIYGKLQRIILQLLERIYSKNESLFLQMQ